MDYEKTIGAKSPQPWTCIETAHRHSRENATHTYVQRQIGGEDCGVYVCMFVDLISQRRSPAEAEHIWTSDARTALRKQLLGKQNPQTTPVLRTDTTRDDYGVFTGAYLSGESDEKDTYKTDKQPAETRRSGRTKKTRLHSRAGGGQEHKCFSFFQPYGKKVWQKE